MGCSQPKVTSFCDGIFMIFLFKALGAPAHSIHKRPVSSKCQSCIGMGEKLIFPSWGARHASRFLSKLARFVAPLWGATFLQRTHHALIFSWWKMALLHFGASRLSCLRWDSGILGRILNAWFYQMEHQGLHNNNKQLMPCFPAATPRATSPLKRADAKRNESEWYMKGLL